MSTVPGYVKTLVHISSFIVSISAENRCFLQNTEKQEMATETLMHMSNTDKDQKEGFGSVAHLSSFPWFCDILYWTLLKGSRFNVPMFFGWCFNPG